MCVCDGVFSSLLLLKNLKVQQQQQPASLGYGWYRSAGSAALRASNVCSCANVCCSMCSRSSQAVLCDFPHFTTSTTTFVAAVPGTFNPPAAREFSFRVWGFFMQQKYTPPLVLSCWCFFIYNHNSLFRAIVCCTYVRAISTRQKSSEADVADLNSIV